MVEYKVLDFSDRYVITVLEDELNQLGSEGWMLLHVHQELDAFSDRRYIFMRVKVSE